MLHTSTSILLGRSSEVLLSRLQSVGVKVKGVQSKGWTTGSDASAKALKFVLSMFQPDRSTGKGRRVPIHVCVLHVMPLILYPGLAVANKTLLEQSVQKLTKAGFTAEPLCYLGNPAEEIMKAASHQQADLIVMGAKGLGAIVRFFLGSVSTRVAQHASCAVLVVR